MRPLAALILPPVLLAASATAQPATPAADWPTSPQAARSGAFAVRQFATTEPDALIAAWRKPGAGVDVPVSHRVRMGRPIASFVVFRGCRPGPRGQCDVATEWRLFDPAGRPGLHATMTVWSGPPPAPGAILLSRDSAKITFAPPDRAGAYLLRARTTDRVAGITLETNDTLVVERAARKRR